MPVFSANPAGDDPSDPQEGVVPIGRWRSLRRAMGRLWPLSLRGGTTSLRLRTLLSLSFGIMSIAIIAVVVTVMTYESERQIEVVVHRELRQVSEQASDRVAKWLYERSADLKLMSGLMVVAQNESTRRYAINKVKQIYPASTAWLAYVDPDCRVITSSDGLYEGQTYPSDVCLGRAERVIIGQIHRDDTLPKSIASKAVSPGSSAGLWSSTDDEQAHYYLPMAYPVVTEDGRILGRIIMEVRTAYIDNLLTTVPLAVADGTPARTYIVSRQSRTVIIGGECAGTALSDEFMANIDSLDAQSDVEWPDGRGFLSASYPSKSFRDIPNLNWVVAARTERGGALELVNDLSTRILQWGVGLSVGAVLLALALAKSIGRPLEALTMFATNTIPREEAVADAARARYREIAELAGALEKRFLELTLARDHAAAALIDREALLKEVHHRVKNNLQVIISLMRLQGSRIRGNPGGQVVVERLTSRVQVIGWLYSKLYERAIFSKISARSFLEPLVSVIQDTYVGAQSLSVRAEICDLDLGFDQTLVLGMMAIEVVTNAMQHAYPGERRSGAIRVRLDDLGGHAYAFVVEDEGCGFDAKRRYNGIGLTMAGRMAVQLGDALDIQSTERGTTVRLTFRIAPDQPDGPLPSVSA